MPTSDSPSLIARFRNVFALLLAALIVIAGAALLMKEEPKAAAGQASNGTPQDLSAEERLWQLRNLGKAFYENPTTQKEAVETFKQAYELAPDSVRERLNYGLALMHAGNTEEAVDILLEVEKQAPEIPNPWFVLGIHYRKSGEDEKALAQFEQLAKLDPDEAKTQYNLGVLYKQRGENEKAIRQFEKAAELAPSLAAPHFQLFNMYRLAGDREKANERLAKFREIKKQQEGAVIPEDMDWSDFAEIYDPIDPEVAQGDIADVPRFQFAATQLDGTVDPATAGSLVFDLMGDGKPALVVWSKNGVRIYKNDGAPFDFSPFGDRAGVRDVSAVDVDNDGLVDLCVTFTDGAWVFKNLSGRFERKYGGITPGSEVAKTLWLDYDHDYDMDMILLGARPMVLRNQGEQGLVPQPNSIPFVAGKAVDGVVIRQFPDTKGMDFIVSYADRGGVLYRDRLGGSFEAIDLNVVPRGAHSLRVADFDSSGTLDFAYLDGENVKLIANDRGTWSEARTVPAAGGYLFGDFANLAVEDLLADGVFLANKGAAFSQSRDATRPEAKRSLVAADFNLDGKLDFAGVGDDGSVFRYENQTEAKNRWLLISLNGVKAPKAARGAIVEVKAGARYQKHFYDGKPLHVGMRNYTKADTIRITWPNGLIQNEMNQETNKAYSYEEAQRLSGSCPMIFTWNGKKFTFITDVLGVAPLGAKSGDGSYFPTNSDEYVWIDGEDLQVRDGKLSIRITEELGEVSYLDQLELIAVDHPAAVGIYSNEKWKSPPYPEFRLFGTATPVHPIAAISQGADVRQALLKRDQVYVDNFERNFQNVAEMHTMELDFGDAALDNDAFLVLNGWVDWADGSTFLAREQEGDGGLRPPYLQVRDPKGEWQTVIDDLGMPSGKTKTLALDLSGKFLSKSRKLRIVTNLCVFWDEVFLGEGAAEPELKLSTLPALRAELRYHGFSTSIIHPERRKPEHFEYEPTTVLSYWNPTRGNYTRYGDVLNLITEIDDRFVVMGSADETVLEYDASSAPALPAGWKRDYLLRVEGWAKDADANTAFGESVEPLPFHKMSQYPYPAGEHYPQTPEHREYVEKYNTRPALRYTRPLTR